MRTHKLIAGICKKASDFCFAKPVTPITNCLKALLLATPLVSDSESIAIREGLNSVISDLIVCKWSSKPADSGVSTQQF